MKSRNTTEMMLMVSPHLPKSNLDGSSGSPRILLRVMHEMEMRYDVNIDATPSEMTCM